MIWFVNSWVVWAFLVILTFFFRTASFPFFLLQVFEDDLSFKILQKNEVLQADFYCLSFLQRAFLKFTWAPADLWFRFWMIEEKLSWFSLSFLNKVHIKISTSINSVFKAVWRIKKSFANILSNFSWSESIWICIWILDLFSLIQLRLISHNPVDF